MNHDEELERRLRAALDAKAEADPPIQIDERGEQEGDDGHRRAAGEDRLGQRARRRGQLRAQRQGLLHEPLLQLTPITERGHAHRLAGWPLGKSLVGGRAVLPLGRRILLSSRRHPVNDRYADQTENTDSDPLLGHVQQVGTDRQADNQYDVADNVKPE